MSDEINEVLNAQQRMARARSLNRIRAKIVRSKARNAKKLATPDMLQSRARRAAIQLLRQRIAGKLGAHYSSLSVSQKMQIDKRVQASKGLINRLSVRLLNRVKTKEVNRYKNLHKAQESVEYLDEISKAKLNDYREKAKKVIDSTDDLSTMKKRAHGASLANAKIAVKEEVGKVAAKDIGSSAGAGKEGTSELANKYKSETPGQEGTIVTVTKDEELYGSAKVVKESAAASTYTIIFDSPSIENIKLFGQKIKAASISVIRATNKGIQVILKSDEEKDKIVDIADELGIGVDVKMGAKS